MLKIQTYSPDKEVFKIKLLVYGSPGVGKTVFASTSEKPLFIDTEKGMMSVQRKLDFVSINNFSEFEELLRDIVMNVDEYKKKYKTLVVDSISELQKRSMDGILDEAMKKNVTRDPNLITQNDWGKNTEQMRKSLRLLRDLSEHFNIVLTALAKEAETDEGLKRRPATTPALFDSINAYVDLIGFMGIKEIPLDNDQVKIQRYLVFTQTPKIIAKSRIPGFPKIIMDPTWDKIKEAVKKNKS